MSLSPAARLLRRSRRGADQPPSAGLAPAPRFAPAGDPCRQRTGPGAGLLRPGRAAHCPPLALLAPPRRLRGRLRDPRRDGRPRPVLLARLAQSCSMPPAPWPLTPGAPSEPTPCSRPPSANGANSGTSTASSRASPTRPSTTISTATPPERLSCSARASAWRGPWPLIMQQLLIEETNRLVIVESWPLAAIATEVTFKYKKMLLII